MAPEKTDETLDLKALDAALLNAVDETSTDDEKKKKEETKEKTIKISIKTFQKIAAAPYEICAIFLGDHWRLDKYEMTMAGEALKELMEAMGPDWLIKYFPVLGFALVNMEIIARKAKTHRDLKNAEAEAEAEAAAADVAKALEPKAKSVKKLTAEAQGKKVKKPPKKKPPKKPKGGKDK